jgi:hypothetical protein
MDRTHMLPQPSKKQPEDFCLSPQDCPLLAKFSLARTMLSIPGPANPDSLAFVSLGMH